MDIQAFIKAHKFKILAVLGVLLAILGGELTGWYSIIEQVKNIFPTSQPAN